MKKCCATVVLPIGDRCDCNSTLEQSIFRVSEYVRNYEATVRLKHVTFW